MSLLISFFVVLTMSNWGFFCLLLNPLPPRASFIETSLWLDKNIFLYYFVCNWLMGFFSLIILHTLWVTMTPYTDLFLISFHPVYGFHHFVSSSCHVYEFSHFFLLLMPPLRSFLISPYAEWVSHFLFLLTHFFLLLLFLLVSLLSMSFLHFFLSLSCHFILLLPLFSVS